MRYTQEPLGSHVDFSNGKASPARDTFGIFPIYGSNGQIGFSDHQNAPPQTSIIGRVGTYCGSVHFSKNACWITDNAIKAVAKEQKEARFWFYAMLHRGLHDLRSGSGQPLINQSSLNNTMVSVPPDSLARIEIAAILSVLDDKIELNRKTAVTLEEMARALYRSWFVDFDPVHAKAEGRAPAHMDAETAALFPDKFSGDGIPDGWKLGILGDLANVNPETHSKRNHPEQIEYVDLANTKWGVIEVTTKLEWAKAPSRARMVLRDGDTIVGTVRPGNGSYSFIGRNGLTGSTGFAVLRAKRDIDCCIIYLAATDPDVISELANLADGGAYPAVRPDVVANRGLSIASTTLRDKFALYVQPMLLKIEALKMENQTLATLRDTLLPRLMSGELRVPTALEMINEVA